MNPSFEKALLDNVREMSIEFTVIGAIGGFAFGAVAALMLRAVLA